MQNVPQPPVVHPPLPQAQQVLPIVHGVTPQQPAGLQMPVPQQQPAVMVMQGPQQGASVAGPQQTAAQGAFIQPNLPNFGMPPPPNVQASVAQPPVAQAAVAPVLQTHMPPPPVQRFAAPIIPGQQPGNLRPPIPLSQSEG